MGWVPLLKGNVKRSLFVLQTVLTGDLKVYSYGTVSLYCFTFGISGSVCGARVRVVIQAWRFVWMMS